MKRSIQKWQDSDPDYMIKKLSRLGLLSALRDAKADILELHAEVERLRGALETVQHHTGERVCCCGDYMDSHPATSDHAPVDAVEYFIRGVLKDRVE